MTLPPWSVVLPNQGLTVCAGPRIVTRSKRQEPGLRIRLTDTREDCLTTRGTGPGIRPGRRIRLRPCGVAVSVARRDGRYCTSHKRHEGSPGQMDRHPTTTAERGRGRARHVCISGRISDTRSRLGHIRMSTTQDLYLHYLPTHDAAAVELIGQTLDDGISLRTQRTPMGRQRHVSRRIRRTRRHTSL